MFCISVFVVLAVVVLVILGSLVAIFRIVIVVAFLFYAYQIEALLCFALLSALLTLAQRAVALQLSRALPLSLC